MSTQRRTPRAWRQSFRLLLSTLCACVGTPTPEPPDYSPLPAASADGFLRDGRVTVLTEDGGIPLSADARTVPGESEVTLINLDDPQTNPVTVRALPNGSFNARVPARTGQRVRLLYRFEGKHSLPLDLIAQGNFESVALLPIARDVALDCVQIEPSNEITRAVRAGESATSLFTIDNRCTEAVTITRAELRFGDRGFRLTSPPDSVPANSQAELRVLFPQHTGEGDRSDIVLVEMQIGEQLERQALGVWSIAPSDD